MKTTRAVLLALLLGSLAGATFAQTSISAGIHIGPSGRASVDIGFFYDDLASYGNWIEQPSYGWVWAPRVAATTWRPYQDGHWVWTDLGWTWVSDEPYGWATYHYGRWYDDPELGWVWVPGNEWGPAWVSWQEGDDYIGWAPLPPSVDISFGGVLSVSLVPEAYVFVPERYFLAPRITTYIVPETRVRGFWGRTHNFTRYRHSGDRIYNDGVPVEQVQRFVGRPVPRYQIADVSSARAARVQGNRVSVFRPQVQRANVPPPSQRPAARKAVVSAEQFRQSHPNHPGRRAAAQGANAPGAQPAPNPKAQQPPTRSGMSTGRRQHGTMETAPPGQQRNPAPQPPATKAERQRPPRQQEQPQPQPQVQEKRQPRNQPPPQERPQHQRPPQENTPPPQHQQRQVEPKKERQPPPPQQQKQQQEEKNKKEKEKQQEEHKPPQR